MEEKQQRKSVRDEFAEKFCRILESDKPLEWTKGWSTQGISLPYNGQTGRRYNGVNRMVLLFNALENNYQDPRYYTFKQVSEMEGCKVRAGEKATAVEYWLVYDMKEKRSMTFSEYEKMRKTGVITHYMDPVEKLAAEMDQFAFDYDPYEYYDTTENRETGYKEVLASIRSGNIQHLRDWLRPIATDKGNVDASQAQWLLNRLNKLASGKLTAYGKELEALYLVDDSIYLHIQQTDEGWDYTLYDKKTRKQIDGGVLEDAVVNESPISRPLAAARIEIMELEGIPGKTVFCVDRSILHQLQEANEVTLRQSTASEKQQPQSGKLPRKESEFRIYAKRAYVFNAAQIEGLELLQQPEKAPLEENLLADEVIKTMAENMEVKLVYGSDEAYYRPATDTVHLPPYEAFDDAASRISTSLHELAHSTSAPSRLNRPIWGYYQDPDRYAMEELRAEIASSFVSAEIDLAMSESAIDNNLAYVQHWLTAIKEDHNVLFAAIKEADKIADYMIEKGRVEELREKLTVAAQMPRQLQGISYEIWQLKDIPENKALMFSDYAYASLFRLTESRYNKVYETQAGSDDYTLDQIYYKYNVNHPEDYKGHSLSMSDVVVLNIDGQRTAWYCDRIGFKQVENFSKAPQQTEKRGRTR